MVGSVRRMVMLDGYGAGKPLEGFGGGIGYGMDENDGF